MVVKIHGPAISSPTRRVLACLIEKEIEYEIIHIDLYNGGQKDPEFLKLQPFGQIPVVEDGDFILYELKAILRYYAEKFKSQGTELLGKTIEERGVVEQWMEVEGQNYNPHTSNIVVQLLFYPKLGLPVDMKLVEESENC